MRTRELIGSTYSLAVTDEEVRLARQSGPLSHDRITSHIQSEIEAEQQAVLGAGR